MPIKLRKSASALVPVPEPAYVQLYVDDDGLPKIKDSDGAVLTLAQAPVIALEEQDTDPRASASTLKLYSKNVGGNTELFALDSSDNEIQITEQGGLAGFAAEALQTTGSAVFVAGAPPPAGSGKVLATTSATTAAWQDQVAAALQTDTGSVVWVNAAPPTSGQVLTAVDAFTAEWSDPSGLGGDVVGPAGAINGLVATFDGSTGKLLKSSTTPNLGTPSAGTLTNCNGRVNANQTADRIATSGAAINISSTAPTAGQVLTADSASAASWKSSALAPDAPVIKGQTTYNFAVTGTVRQDVPGMLWTGITTGRYWLEVVIAAKANTVNTVFHMVPRWISGGTAPDALGEQWYINPSTGTVKWAVALNLGGSADGLKFPIADTYYTVNFQTLLYVTAASASFALNIGGNANTVAGDVVTVNHGIGRLTYAGPIPP